MIRSRRIKIEHPALNRKMEYIMSGGKVYFRFEKPKGEWCWVSKESHDVALDMIDGYRVDWCENECAWYYRLECPECLSGADQKPKRMPSYCDEHNRCIDCNTKRKDLGKNSAFWVRDGAFRCNSCEEDRKAKIKDKALERIQKNDYDEWKYLHLDLVKCPWCNHETDGGDYCEDGHSETVECEECEFKFTVIPDYSVTYSMHRDAEGE